MSTWVGTGDPGFTELMGTAGLEETKEGSYLTPGLSLAQIHPSIGKGHMDASGIRESSDLTPH